MAQALFSTPISSERDTYNVAANKAARQIPDERVCGATLEALVNEICVAPSLLIAKLQFEERRGKRQGGKIMVSIPFEGYPKSLMTRPSRASVLNFPAHIQDKSVIAEFPDDDRLDKNVDALVEAISVNLENLKQEWQTLADFAKPNVLAILTARKNKLEAEKARDAKRSFPID